MKDLTILTGDAWEMLREVEPNSVHCAITSPPYFGLRDYQVAGQIGLEKTPEEYIENLVRVFRRLRRALRPDGTFWLNIGDSYATSGPTGGAGKQHSNKGSAGVACRSAKDIGYKHKDRMGIPHRLVFALQADGWYWRDEIIWHSPNKMPESCTDRCTKAHEFIFLLTKSPKYFFDYIAIRETQAGGIKTPRFNSPGGSEARAMGGKMSGNEGTGALWTDSGFRNKRSVWTIPSNGDKELHFAAYPKKLILPCILAGTSAKGCCPECGAPYERILEKRREPTRPGLNSKVHSAKNAHRLPTGAHSMKTTLASVVGNKDPERHVTSAKTIGWRPTCDCKFFRLKSDAPAAILSELKKLGYSENE